MSRNADVERISYFYECSDAIIPAAWSGRPLSSMPVGENILSENSTWAEFKAVQLKYGGDYHATTNPDGHKWGQEYDPTLFPVVRCFWHVRTGQANDRAPIFNAAYAGNVFLSRLQWERGTWTAY
jgi:hypothetical protein